MSGRICFCQERLQNIVNLNPRLNLLIFHHHVTQWIHNLMNLSWIKPLTLTKWYLQAEFSITHKLRLIPIHSHRCTQFWLNSSNCFQTTTLIRAAAISLAEIQPTILSTLLTSISNHPWKKTVNSWILYRLGISTLRINTIPWNPLEIIILPNKRCFYRISSNNYSYNYCSSSNSIEIIYNSTFQMDFHIIISHTTSRV